MTIQEAVNNALANEITGNYQSAVMFWGKAANICLAEAKKCALKSLGEQK